LLPEPHLGLLGAVLIGALLNLASQAGDLLESAFKRHAGVKDSGLLFGPSGGVLDLVDSLLLSAPALLLVQLLLLP
jgi:phosphatidate cytidylyltransferase